MRMFFSFTAVIVIMSAVLCDNPSNNDDHSAAFIENNKFFNTDIKFSVVFPQTWILTMDTTVDNVKYNLFARKPATDSAVFTIKIFKNVNETNVDTIMVEEESKLKNSLENYITNIKSGCGIPHTVSGCFGYSYSMQGKNFNNTKIFSIKGTSEIIFHATVIAEPILETAFAVRDIVGSIIFE